MIFQVELTPISEAQIDRTYRWYRERNPDFADRWFRSLMNRIATLQEKPHRCGLAIEHEIFPEKVRQLFHGKSKNIYRVLFVIRESNVYILFLRHSSQSPLTIEDIESEEYT